jgi:hypothetical protein
MPAGAGACAAVFTFSLTFSLTFTRLAGAQSGQDQAAAEALFRQARDQMAAGHYADACPKFAESERLDPAPGTLLNLATCYEKSGQIASAWVTYKEAALSARRADQPERAQFARGKADELEATLPTLTIHVPDAADRPDLEVKRDGQLVARAEWEAPIPVDAGAHDVEASAPGRKTWQGRVDVTGAGAKASVEIPVLETAPVARPALAQSLLIASAGTAAPVTHGSGQRITGVLVGGAGLAGLVVGTVFGLVAKSENDTAKSECLGNTLCDTDGYASNRDAHTSATVSTIAFAAGAAFLAVGVVLYATAPSGMAASPATASVGVAPFAGPDAAGAMVHGTW